MLHLACVPTIVFIATSVLMDQYFVRGDTNLPPTETQALQDFYTSTNGPFWNCYYGWEQPWVFSDTANPCVDYWVGVTCTLDTEEDYYHVHLLDLQQCNLDGSIPTTIGHLTRLSECRFGGNHLRGTIPDVFATMRNLSGIFWSFNSLTGTLPPSMALLTNLSFLHLYENKLTGPIEQAFDPSTQTQLTEVVLSANGFTGQIPSSMFLSSSLQYINLGYNCFSGTLPEGICEGTALQNIELSCLSCGTNCITNIFPKSAYLTHHSVHGTIPACIFSLPYIESLAFEMNYLSGTLPPDVRSEYPGLGVSYNLLTGTIPTALFQSVACVNEGYLDVSYNRFTGRIPHMQAGYQSSIILTYNRMSGPAFGNNWSTSADIDVLSGNIFSCDRNHNNLPAQDKAANRYQCGSDATNQPLLAWCGCAVACVLFIVAAYFYSPRIVAYVDLAFAGRKMLQWWSIAQGNEEAPKTPQLRLIYETTQMICVTGIVVTSVALVVLLPIYAGLTTEYGTYDNQYAWTLSSVLLAGRVPFGACFALFLLTLATAFGLLQYQHGCITAKHTAAAVKQVETASDTEAVATSLHRVLIASMLYLGINFGVVGVVNVAFVATSIYTTPVYQLGISVFKVGWNVLFSPILSRWLAYELSAARADWFTLELFVSIMNIVGIPLLAVVFVSPQCLYDLVGGRVNARYGETYSLRRPFYYSYQCSYVYMDYYSAALVYASLMTTFGTPLLEVTLQQLHRNAPAGSWWFRVLDTVLPRSLKPVETEPSRIPDRNILRPLLDSTQFLVAQFTSLAVILTMGVVFPPLSVPIAAAMIISSSFVFLKVGRLMRSALDAGAHKYIEILEQECANVATVTTMQRAFWMLLWFACWFYTLFLFDTLGDAVGFYGAYWVLIVMPLMPLVVVFGSILAAWICGAPRSEDLRTKKNEALNTVEIELVESPLPKTQNDRS